MNAAFFQLQAAHVALAALAAVVSEQTGRPPATTDRRTLDLYLVGWNDRGGRTKAEVLGAVDEAIARLERSLNGDPNETEPGE